MGFHLYAKNTPLRDQGYEVGFALNLPDVLGDVE